eukprot:gene9516-biopygen10194
MLRACLWHPKRGQDEERGEAGAVLPRVAHERQRPVAFIRRDAEKLSPVAQSVLAADQVAEDPWHTLLPEQCFATRYHPRGVAIHALEKAVEAFVDSRSNSCPTAGSLILPERNTGLPPTRPAPAGWHTAPASSLEIRGLRIPAAHVAVRLDGAEVAGLEVRPHPAPERPVYHGRLGPRQVARRRRGAGRVLHRDAAQPRPS